MKKPTDIIWDAITNSAKKRFDYDEFKAAFSELDNDNAPENILFKTIVGYVEGKSKEEIADEINNELLPLGCRFPDSDLQDFLSNKAIELGREIHATKIASTLLDQGMPIPGVLVQVKRILAGV